MSKVNKISSLIGVALLMYLCNATADSTITITGELIASPCKITNGDGVDDGDIKVNFKSVSISDLISGNESAYSTVLPFGVNCGNYGRTAGLNIQITSSGAVETGNQGVKTDVAGLSVRFQNSEGAVYKIGQSIPVKDYKNLPVIRVQLHKFDTINSLSSNFTANATIKVTYE